MQGSNMEAVLPIPCVAAARTNGASGSLFCWFCTQTQTRSRVLLVVALMSCKVWGHLVRLVCLVSDCSNISVTAACWFDDDTPIITRLLGLALHGSLELKLLTRHSGCRMQYSSKLPLYKQTLARKCSSASLHTMPPTFLLNGPETSCYSAEPILDVRMLFEPARESKTNFIHWHLSECHRMIVLLPSDKGW